MQAQQIAQPFPVGTLFASLIGVVIVAIAYLSLTGVQVPLLGSERAAFIAVGVLGFGMCIASGIGRTTSAGQFGLTSVIVSVLGVLAVLVIVSVIAGWTTILDPVGQVVYGGSASMDRIGIVSLTAIIGVMWFLSTLRQLGLVGGSGS
jgi:hypothetical protein